MALGRKCDRCGAFYLPETNVINSEEFNAFMPFNRDLRNKLYSNRIYDLCPDCLDSFIKWLNNDNQKEA